MTKRLSDMTDAEKIRHYEYVRSFKENMSEEERGRRREYYRQYRASHLEQVRKTMRRYNKNHQESRRKKDHERRDGKPELSREASRKWREAHPEYAREWRKRHLEESRESVRQWEARNREHEAARSFNYRTRLRGNGGNHTPAEWRAMLDKYGHKCLCCGAIGVKLTRDHVLPVELGGSGDIGNLQPLCLSCNSSKNARYIDYRPDSYFADWT